MVVNSFPAATTALPWQVHGPRQVRSSAHSNHRPLPSLTHHHYLRTPRCLQLLLISLVRRARAAGLLLRLPASQAEQATARSAAAGHAGGQEATCPGFVVLI